MAATDVIPFLFSLQLDRGAKSSAEPRTNSGALLPVPPLLYNPRQFRATYSSLLSEFGGLRR
jgi:hypothetical protein